MTETFFFKKDEESKFKRKRPSALYDIHIQASTSVKSMLNQSKTVSSFWTKWNNISARYIRLSYNHAPTVEEIFEVADEPLVISIRHLLQSSEGQEKLRANWSVKTEIFESDKKTVNIDIVYEVYFSNEGTMLGQTYHLVQKWRYNYRWKKIQWNTGLVRINFQEIFQ